MEWLRREMLDVDMNEAEVIVLEGALALGGTFCSGPGSAAQALCFKNTPDAVAIEGRQEVADNKSQVIEGEVGGPAHGADNGTLLLGWLPRQPMGLGGMVEAVCRTALAPFADGLGADAIALRQEAAGLL